MIFDFSGWLGLARTASERPRAGGAAPATGRDVTLRATAFDFVPNNPFVPLARQATHVLAAPRSGGAEGRAEPSDELLRHRAATAVTEAAARREEAEAMPSQCALRPGAAFPTDDEGPRVWSWSRAFWSWVATAEEPAAGAVCARQQDPTRSRQQNLPAYLPPNATQRNNLSHTHSHNNTHTHTHTLTLLFPLFC